MSPMTSQPRGGLSRRSFLKLVIAAGGASAAAGSLVPETAHAEEAYPERFTFAVMSDVHLFAPELWSDCPDYTTAENSDRKMFRESSDILDKALADVVAAKPDMVLVPGDLTKDGELVCHEWVRDRFAAARQQLAAAGVDTQFYVINGNHDLNNHHGKDFSGGSSADAERTDPLTYKSLWAECGYTDTVVYDADGTADGSLSYVAHPCSGLTLIAVDTCKYNVAAEDGTLAQETSGHVSADLLAWVCDQAREARAAGDVVVAFQHHGIVPHFGYEPVIFGEYLVDDYEAVAKAYADAGISAVFTGHMHANDIAAATYGENTIYDIETGSLVTYPSRMRMGSLEFAQRGERLECTLTVDSHDLGDVTLDECGLATTAGITAYGKERTLTVDSVTTMLNGYVVDPLVAQIDAAGGITPVIAGLVGCEAAALPEVVWSLLAGILPGSPEAAVEAGLSFDVLSSTVAIYYNAETDQIEAAEPADPAAAAAPAAVTLDLTSTDAAEFADALAATPMTLAAGELVLHITHVDFSAFLAKLLDELDAKVFMSETGRPALIGILTGVVRSLLEAPVDEDPAHTVLGLVDFAYQAHLMGCEQSADWVEMAIEGVGAAENNLLESVAGTCLDTALEGSEFMDLARTVTFNLNELIVGDNSLGKLAMMLLLSNKKNLAELLQLVSGTLGIELGGTLAGLLVGLSLFNDEPLTTTAQNALDTLVHDTNVTEDHDFSLEASAALPSDPGGDEDVVDKSGLQAAIDQASSLDVSGASQSALDQYYGALAAALRVASDPDATAAEVDAARSALAAAIQAVRDSQASGGDGGSGSGNAGSGSGNGGGGSTGGPGAGGSGNGGSGSGRPGTGKLPDTGDRSSTVAPVAAAVLGGIAVAAGVGVRAMGGSAEE